ncbi:hypothetical protein BG004_002762 [Podila humilis]|nr:hypothetical protein BG004_002762 [Podila humilis]
MTDATVLQHVCLVDRILDKRVDPGTGQAEYLISWQGFDAQGNEFDDTWEPENNVLGEDLVVEYERSVARRHQKSLTQQKTLASSDAPESSSAGKDTLQPQQEHAQQPQQARHVLSPTHPTTSSTIGLHPRSSDQPLHHPTLFGTGPYKAPHLPYGYFVSYPAHYETTPPPTLATSPSQDNIYIRPIYGRPSGNTTWSLKRKASQSLEHDSSTLQPKGTSNKENTTMSYRSNSVNGTVTFNESDDPKRPKDFRGTALSRRAVSSSKIRIMTLDLDKEKIYFKGLIEKSALIKDPDIRNDLIQFLRDPKAPGLSDTSPLLKSDMWLVELVIKADCSLCLVLDISDGAVKAVSIPKEIISKQTNVSNDMGTVINDRATVLSILSGDFKDRTHEPLVGKKEFSPMVSETHARTQGELAEDPSDATQSSIGPPAVNVQLTKDEDMTSTEPSQHGTAEFKCGWKGCTAQQQPSREMLAKHVMQNHLWHFHSTGNVKEMDADILCVLGANQVDSHSAEQTWRERYELIKEAYDYLQEDISKLKDLVSNAETRICDSNSLYEKSLRASVQFTKRLEAQMEWEETKWQQYQAQVAVMEKRQHQQSLQDSDVGSQDEIRAQSVISGIDLQSGDQPNDKKPVKHSMDKPMVSQASNTIREIHRLLIYAKQEQEMLKVQNEALFQERQVLSAESKRVETSYEEVAIRLQELEAKHAAVADELQQRAFNVEKLRLRMEQKREETQAKIEQLQARIGELMGQTTSTTTSTITTPLTTSLPRQITPAATTLGLSTMPPVDRPSVSSSVQTNGVIHYSSSLNPTSATTDTLIKVPMTVDSTSDRAVTQSVVLAAADESEQKLSSSHFVSNPELGVIEIPPFIDPDSSPGSLLFQSPSIQLSPAGSTDVTMLPATTSTTTATATATETATTATATMMANTTPEMSAQRTMPPTVGSDPSNFISMLTNSMAGAQPQ